MCLQWYLLCSFSLRSEGAALLVVGVLPWRCLYRQPQQTSRFSPGEADHEVEQ